MSRLSCDLKITRVGRPGKYFTTMGEYDAKSGKSTLYLNEIWNYFGGEGVTHSSIIRAISELQCHEILHRMVRSGSPNTTIRTNREHTAIGKLMKASDMKHIYTEK